MGTVQVQSRNDSILGSIHSMLVLYGSVRSTDLARRIDRSLLDLPLTRWSTILEHQMDHAQRCADRFGFTDFEMKVLVDTESRKPESPVSTDSVVCEVMHDVSPIRGVAGVLADATKDIDDDQYIVVASGAQVYLEPLADLVHAMAKKESDVAFVSTAEGAPVGIWLIRCGVLRSVNPVGYVDLKEQALMQWRDEYKVSVVERRHAYAHPTRSIFEYIGAIRAIEAGHGVGATIDEDPFREDWESVFSLVESGAQVAEDAILHDSIALSGATVGKGAVIVRSVVCPGAVVAPGARVADKVITGNVKRERGRR